MTFFHLLPEKAATREDLKMAQIDCGRGHFYDDEKHSSCPYCGVPFETSKTDWSPKPDLDDPYRPDVPTDPFTDQTAPFTQPIDPERPIPETKRTKNHRPLNPTQPSDDRPTIPAWRNQSDPIDPVVGWLVCIKGPDRGRDYRIRNDRNFIGRAPEMDLSISGDDTISRKNHAELIYDPVGRNFFIASGSSRGLVYLNNLPVLAPTPLSDRGIIRLGNTELMFVPLCTDDFSWDDTKTPSE